MEKAPQLGGEKQETGREPMLPHEAHDELTELREYIQREVAVGIEPRDILIEMAVHYFELDEDNPIYPMIEPVLDAALAAHYEAQKTWGITDCERLDAAFDELNQRGIVARQHWSCCGTCGVAEIWHEMQSFEEARGYTFYHWQDSDSAAEYGGLYLNYGAVADEEQTNVDLAWEIVNVLRKHDLKVAWSGNLATRILINLDWKHRRPVEPLVYA